MKSGPIESERSRRNCLVAVSRHEHDATVDGKGPRLLQRSGEVDGIERAQSLREHQPARRGEDRLGAKAEQGDRSSIGSAVGLDPGEQGALRRRRLARAAARTALASSTAASSLVTTGSSPSRRSARSSEWSGSSAK